VQESSVHSPQTATLVPHHAHHTSSSHSITPTAPHHQRPLSLRGMQPGGHQKHASFETCTEDVCEGLALVPSSCELLVQHQLLLACVSWQWAHVRSSLRHMLRIFFCHTAQHSSIGFEHRHSSLNTVLCDTASQQQHTRSNTLRCAPNSYRPAPSHATVPQR